MVEISTTRNFTSTCCDRACNTNSVKHGMPILFPVNCERTIKSVKSAAIRKFYQLANSHVRL